MLIFTFFFALGTGVGLSQQKADANCNKEISFSSRFTASLAWFGLFWFSFLLKSIRFVESTGLYLWREVLYWHLLQRSCTEQQKVLLMNFCRLASPAKLTLNWYNCFQQAKAHTHRCSQEGADQSFVALLPLMAKQWSHLCTQLHLGDSESHSSFQASSMPECQT